VLAASMIKIAIGEQMNRTEWDDNRLLGQNCFRKSHSMTINESQTKTGDNGH
jgi:hypothetical protein